ncbi:MAG TPA: SRPBCC family protein [Solirubrobacteraceae bacterium]|nr:SRPBCC family protein [Solirubrobacteraceae bacterium]
MPEVPGSRGAGCDNHVRMATVTASAAKAVDAPPERVLEFLRDYRQERPRILTENYTAYRVEQGGNGAGTVIGYHFAAGGRERDYRLSVDEEGGELVERDQLSSFVSRWTVAPNGSGSEVTLESSWQGAGGIGGMFERTFAPMGLRRIYGQMLDKLAAAVSAGAA